MGHDHVRDTSRGSGRQPVGMRPGHRTGSGSPYPLCLPFSRRRLAAHPVQRGDDDEHPAPDFGGLYCPGLFPRLLMPDPDPFSVVFSDVRRKTSGRGNCSLFRSLSSRDACRILFIKGGRTGFSAFLPLHSLVSSAVFFAASEDSQIENRIKRQPHEITKKRLFHAVFSRRDDENRYV